MKRKFLKVSLLMLLTGAMSATFVGCKDYDDDITNINSTTDSMSEQMKALESALKANQDAAAAAAASAQQALKDAADAAAKGDQALAAAKAAEAQADLAKQAAAQAKVDAIKEVTEALKPLIDNNAAASAANAAKLAELAGKIAGIQSDLAKIDLEAVNSAVNQNTAAIQAVNTQLTAINLQISALENFQKYVEENLYPLKGKVEGLETELNTVKTNISNLTTELGGLKTQVSTLENTVKTQGTAISTIQGQITEINTQLTAIHTEITTAVDGALSTIAGIMNGRLTSISLVPQLYVDGIPTIQFFSAQYRACKVDNAGNWKPTGAQFIVSDNSAEAVYQLIPSIVDEKDIQGDKIDVISETPKVELSRATGVNTPVMVKSHEIKNGRLTVKLGKTNTASLNRTDGTVYTVSLKVPVASQHLFKGESEFSVYSEFQRLRETYFTPELRFVPGQMNNPDVSQHLNDSITMYTSAMNKMVAKTMAYDATLDLNTLVQGCMFVNPSTHTPMTLKDLDSFGFGIKFQVATKAYNTSSTDVTNQQAYAQIDGTVLTPILPKVEGQPVVTKNRNIIGKQPIIRAVLYDKVNNQIIEQKYFKIRYTAEPLQDYKVTLPVQLSDLHCGDNSIAISWDTMVQYVFSKFPEGGIDKEEFFKIYTVGSTKHYRKDDPTKADRGDFKALIALDGTGASTPIITWTMTEDELGKLTPGAKITYVGEVEYVDPNELRSNYHVTFEWVIEVPAAPTLNSTNGIYWKGEILEIVPTQMAIPYNGTDKASYATNILMDRKQPYVQFGKDMLSCQAWNIKFASANPSYPGALSFQSGYGHWLMTPANQANLNTITYSIKHDAAGIALVQSANAKGSTDVKLDWEYRLNGVASNTAVFANSTLRILQILKLNTVAATQIVDDSKESRTKLAPALRLTDPYGHLVAEQATADERYAADYYKFYGVQAPVFSNNIKVSVNADGSNAEALSKYNMSATVDASTGELVYHNSGTPLQKDLYLIVPVTINHYWGTLTGTIAVPLKKAL